MKSSNWSRITRGVFIFFIAVFILSCTTLKARNQKIIDDYNAIDRSDGIDKAEAYKILKYYMHIQHNYYGVRYLYSSEPEDHGDYWEFSTEYKNLYYENNADDLFFVRIDKKTANVSSRTIRTGIDNDEKLALRKRHQSIVYEDGIDRLEAITKVKYHYYVEAQNQYIHYIVGFNPTETKKYWVFELMLRPNSPLAKQRVDADYKKSESLYLVVNKKSGELFKERSFLKLVQ